MGIHPRLTVPSPVSDPVNAENPVTTGDVPTAIPSAPSEISNSTASIVASVMVPFLSVCIDKFRGFSSFFCCIVLKRVF
jgi:hypothetical protein